jgi:hypothetical protein
MWGGHSCPPPLTSISPAHFRLEHSRGRGLPLWNTSRMARNFRELEAKMSPESRARSQALAAKYRAELAQVPPQVSDLLEKALALSIRDRGLLINRLVASLDNKPAGAADIARWFEELDEFGTEPFPR